MKSINTNVYDYINYSKNYQRNKQDETYIPEPGSLSYQFGTTDHRCYILDLSPRNGVRERLEIQFVPGEITGTRTADLKDIVVVGRNNPFLHYTGGKEMINLPLEFYSDIEAHDDVKKKIDWLRSLTINNGNIGGFRSVKVIFGDLFRWETFAVKAVSYKMSHFDGDSDFLPLRANVGLTLQVQGKFDDENNVINDINIDDFRT